MKSLKKILFVFLALTRAFCLFACGGGKDDPCKTHSDENEALPSKVPPKA